MTYELILKKHLRDTSLKLFGINPDRSNDHDSRRDSQFPITNLNIGLIIRYGVKCMIEGSVEESAVRTIFGVKGNHYWRVGRD